jgi:pyruvate dehydrogenase E2 component (dihydrolipoamide acetyltransferase)
LAEFKVPELGENVAGGDVTSVLVKVGDTIAVDQNVLELETDKATVEVPSSVAGRVTEIKVKPGTKVSVGDVVLVVEEGASAESSPKAQGTSPKSQEEEAESPKAEAKTSKPNATQPEAKDGAAEEPAAEEPEAEEPKAEEPKAEKPKAEEPKAKKPEKVVSMPARKAPESTKPAPRTEAAEAQPKQKAPGPGPQAAGSKSQAPGPKPQVSAAAPAAPSVRRLAREIGANIDEIQGSGPQGRISEEDVKEHARRILSSMPSTPPAPSTGRGAPERPAVPLPDFSRWGEIERQPMSNIRRTTSERLAHAWNTIPHVTQFDKADITGMEELRKKYREQVEAAGGNLTVTAMLVKVMATAVKQFPQFNASLDTQTHEIIYKKYVNVGVAVDTDRGLLVPVVRNADQKNITNIAIEVHQLAEKARNRKLTLEEMSGGGITISNLGGIGGTYFTPIVNWPEVAILGVSRGIVESVWRNDTFEPRQLLPLSLSYDHRVIDGADAMRFLRWVVEAIEQPFLLSLSG